jgi:hypothetical protein
MISPLNERMEIAFYNVIDHRCDNAERMGATPDQICRSIRNYTERYIARHEMPDKKKKELRDFTENICGIISAPS